MPAIEFQGIVKRYGALPVLENLDLQVDDGEFVVLLGPSGCGKTTLLNLLAGLLEVTDGTILIGGEDVTDRDPKDRGLAMVFQSYALYPTKTVRGNLRFGLSARGLPAAEIERRIAWAARFLQIEPLLDRKPAQLSGGQRQRVAIGRALVKQVGVCLFDEPLSNLDAKLRTEMRQEIKRLHTELRNTVVYVTHDQVEAMTMATKIAVMDRGTIQQFGTPDEIYEAPENIFVADFIGAPGMNLVPARLHRNGGWAAAAPSGVRFDLDRYDWRRLPEDGRPVRVGFRPEHAVRAGDGAEGAGMAARLDLPVTYVERIGPEALAVLALPGDAARPGDTAAGTPTMPGSRVAVRLDPAEAARLKPGERLGIAVPAGRLSVFDAETGRRL